MAVGYILAPVWDGPVHRFVAFHGGSGYIDYWRSENVHAASPVITVGPDYDYIVYVGTVDGQVYQLDFHTGEIMGNFSVWPGETKPVRGVAHSSGVIYSSAGNSIYSYKISDGPLWMQETGGMTTIPVVDDGKIYVGSWDDAIHAFDLDGKPIWTSKAADFSAREASVNEGTVYATSYNSKLYALNGNDGSVIWQADTGEDSNFKSPIDISDGIIYATSSNNVYALSADDGTLIWKIEIGHNLSPPTIYPFTESGLVFVTEGHGIGDNYVYALNAVDGTQIWKSQKPVGPNGFHNSQPIVGRGDAYPDNVFVTSQDGYIYAFAISDGWFAWKALINEHDGAWPILPTFSKDPPDIPYYISTPDNYKNAPSGCNKIAKPLRSFTRSYKQQSFRSRLWLSRRGWRI